MPPPIFPLGTVLEPEVTQCIKNHGSSASCRGTAGNLKRRWLLGQLGRSSPEGSEDYQARVFVLLQFSIHQSNVVSFSPEKGKLISRRNLAVSSFLRLSCSHVTVLRGYYLHYNHTTHSYISMPDSLKANRKKTSRFFCS